MEIKLYSPRTKKIEEYTIINKPVMRGKYCALITKTETIIGKFDFKDGIPLIGNQIIPKGMQVKKVLASSEKLEGCLHVKSLSQKDLNSLKSKYAPKQIYNEYNKTNKMKTKFASFFAGMLFFITFGFIDNVFVVFGSWITDLNITIDVAVNGGVWNTISDAAGILVAASVSTLFYKLFKIKENEVSTLQQFIGVIIGCLLPLVIYLII